MYWIEGCIIGVNVALKNLYKEVGVLQT